MDASYGMNVISPYQINSNDLGLLTLYNRRRFLRFVFIFKIVNNKTALSN